MRAANDPTVRIKPRLRRIIPGRTSFVIFSVALLFQIVSGVAKEGGERHVNFDDIG